MLHRFIIKRDGPCTNTPILPYVIDLVSNISLIYFPLAYIKQFNLKQIAWSSGMKYLHSKSMSTMLNKRARDTRCSEKGYLLKNHVVKLYMKHDINGSKMCKVRKDVTFPRSGPRPLHRCLI